ncbi:hypothetical protein ACFFWD_04930 [Bradyrhizobium erythrophlei]|uniref:hypothetical protein n=1 Tax=Bradyrhizobium erythrophlei TaxID=1437360 RepID=UPI0035F065C2
MRPTSAPEGDDIATGTRRKWGEPRHGGAVVNQWLSLDPLIYGPLAAGDRRPLPDVSRYQTNCCSKSSVECHLQFQQLNLFDCARLQSFSLACGAQRKFAMIETVTAVMGLVSAAIFLAHALEGYRYRA